MHADTRNPKIDPAFYETLDRLWQDALDDATAERDADETAARWAEHHGWTR